MGKNGKRAVYERIKQDAVQYAPAFAVFLLYYITVKKIFRAFCPLVIATGFPCPACGMTRAILALARGQFVRSFYLHPMAPFVLLFALYCFCMRYLLGRKIKGFWMMAAVLLAAMLLLYVWRMVTAFPDRPPMSYTRNNVLAEIVKLWQKLKLPRS